MKEVYVLTGANKGLGLELAKLILDNGKSLVAISRDVSNLEKLNGDLNIIKLDLNLSLNPLLEYFQLQPEIKIAALINNAGQLVNKAFTQTTPDDFRQMMEVNFIANIRIIQGLLPFMKRTHIVNIGSMGGVQGTIKFSGLSAYSASKAALLNFTELLAEELKESEIRVNALALGAFSSEMLKEAFPGYNPSMSAKEMAGFVFDFVQNGANYFNGKIIQVSNSTP